MLRIIQPPSSHSNNNRTLQKNLAFLRIWKLPFPWNAFYHLTKLFVTDW